MERTYDVFVDNGLFVLANKINKNIADIKEDDIFNNIDKMCKEIFKFTSVEAFSNLKNMVFPNSALTQKGKNEEDFAQKLREEFREEGDGVCIRCGKKRVNIFNKINKTYMPGIVSLTMYNYANNLQGVNICPYCLALTVFSILNCRVSRDVILFNSTNDNFMKDYTSECSKEYKRMAVIEGNKKYDISEIGLIKKLWGMGNNSFYTGEIQIVRFNNIGLGMPRFEVDNINSRGVELLGKLRKEGLEEEFLRSEYKLYWYLIKGVLTDKYIKNIIKYNTNTGREDVVCSKELFEFLNKEVNGMEEGNLKLIEKICKGIEELEIVSDIYKQISNMGGEIRKLESLLVDLNKSYYDLTNKQLFNEMEFLKLVDRKNYRRVENLLIVKLIGLQSEK